MGRRTEIKVGDVFVSDDGARLVCVESQGKRGCEDCHFCRRHLSECVHLMCCEVQRADGKNVKFVIAKGVE